MENSTASDSSTSRPPSSRPSTRRDANLPHQRDVSKFYNSDKVQVVVALIIILNFFTNIVEKQVDPYAEKYDGTFRVFELVYNILFTIELLINMYAHWMCRFFESAWNIFDVVVVSIGMITTVFTDLPKALSLLRMMRAFRVFRLFKRVKSLSKILATIIYAVPLVMNAFLILAIVMSIYAILAVEFYRDLDADCHTTKIGITKYGNCFGEEYFGRFGKSLYTFFQVLTGESWAEAVARPVIFHYNRNPDEAWDARGAGSAFFFTSFFMIASIVLANVVTTVLLDKILDPKIAAKAEAECQDMEEDDDPPPVEEPAPEPEDPLETKLKGLCSKVEQLYDTNENMRNQLDTNIGEMVMVRDQLDKIVQALSQESNG
jgi:hypothetical protein